MNSDITPLGIAATLLVALIGAFLVDWVKYALRLARDGRRATEIQLARTAIALAEMAKDRPQIVSVLMMQNLGWLIVALGWVVGGVALLIMAPDPEVLRASLPETLRPATTLLVIWPLGLCGYGGGRLVAGAQALARYTKIVTNPDAVIASHTRRLERLATATPKDGAA